MVEKFIISLRKKSERKLDKLILDNCPPNLSLSRTKIQDLIKQLEIIVSDELAIIELAINELERTENENKNTCAPLFKLRDRIADLLSIEEEKVEYNLMQSVSSINRVEKNGKIFLETSKSMERDKKIKVELERIIKKFSYKKRDKKIYFLWRSQ